MILGESIFAVDTPALWVDLDMMERNVTLMAAYMKSTTVNWRPHTKGIKLPAIAHKLIAAGAIGITCAKLSEAEVMAAAGHINASFATGSWEPVRILVGEGYERAVAAMQCYDVLLVNSIADGMNLVAKEGPIVNRHYGQLVLSERTGAREQLESPAIVISPCDISSTADALHKGLTMPERERRKRAQELKALVENEDVFWWLCQQLETVDQLGL